MPLSRIYDFSSSLMGCPYGVGRAGAKVKLLLIGGLVGLAIGVALTVIYFSLATFFGANAKALNAVQKAENSKKSTAEATATQKKRKAHAG